MLLVVESVLDSRYDGIFDENQCGATIQIPEGISTITCCKRAAEHSCAIVVVIEHDGALGCLDQSRPFTRCLCVGVWLATTATRCVLHKAYHGFASI